MAKTDTPPANDKKMWKRLLRSVHPDTGGDGELFVWTRELQKYVINEKSEPVEIKYGNPYDWVLVLVPEDLEEDSMVRASPKQMAFIAHLAGFTDKQRYKWYTICDQINLTKDQAKVVIRRLK